MELYYSEEKNVQILIALLKKHGIRRVIASPGSTNICFVASLEHDPFFEVFSCVDERSAAYMACGMAAETGEPVVLSCTGATASRNYIPGLTEAFYRKLPILAVTSTRPVEQIGHHIPQVLDRTVQLNDMVRESVYLPQICSPEEEWGCVVNANKAILALTYQGGGPAHINLATAYTEGFSVKTLPDVRAIFRIGYGGRFPAMITGRVAVFCGSHPVWEPELTEAVDTFCEKYHALVITDPTGNYNGKYRVFGNLAANQIQMSKKEMSFDLMIHIGEISGSYMKIYPKEVWRVNPDGEIRDTFRKLKYVFAVREKDFFRYYNKKKTAEDPESDATGIYAAFQKQYDSLLKKAYAQMEEIPFSNIWAAMTMAPLLPQNSVLHLGILNSLRSWSFPDLRKDIRVYSNVGGFGIDGCVSSLCGGAIADPEHLHFGVVGDLAFFYDMNALGNRHIGKNLRLMIVNNGLGAEFKLKQTLSMTAGMDDRADVHVAAKGHFGRQSRDLIRGYVQSLGFQYLCADSKDSFHSAIRTFTDPGEKEKPVVLELFTDEKGEDGALTIMKSLEENLQGFTKEMMKTMMGRKKVRTIKKLINR